MAVVYSYIPTCVSLTKKEGRQYLRHKFYNDLSHSLMVLTPSTLYDIPSTCTVWHPPERLNACKKDNEDGRGRNSLDAVYFISLITNVSRCKVSPVGLKLNSVLGATSDFMFRCAKHRAY